MEQILNIWILSNININNMIFNTCGREAKVVFTLAAVTTCLTPGRAPILVFTRRKMKATSLSCEQRETLIYFIHTIKFTLDQL